MGSGYFVKQHHSSKMLAHVHKDTHYSNICNNKKSETSHSHKNIIKQSKINKSSLYFQHKLSQEHNLEVKSKLYYDKYNVVPLYVKLKKQNYSLYCLLT